MFRWLADFIAAFRLARRIQRGDLVALEPTDPRLRPPRTWTTPPPSTAGGRYEVRTVRGDTRTVKIRTDDVTAAKAVFSQSYSVPVEFYDHQLGLVRGRRTGSEPA